MKIKNILEELKDIPIHNVLYHGTSGSNLFKILNDGKLKPKYYFTSISNRKEIAVGRKSMVSGKENPSYNMEGVLFHLFVDRIRGSKEHRGTKIKPLAEFPKRYLDDLKHLTKNFKKEQLMYLEKMVKKNPSCIFDDEEFLKIKRETDLKTDDIERFFSLRKNLKKSTEKGFREKEERIVFKNTESSLNKEYFGLDNDIKKEREGIVLKPEFVKIEITKTPENLANGFISAYKMFVEISDSPKKYKDKNYMINLLDKYDDLFIKNNYFKEFKEKIKKYLTK